MARINSKLLDLWLVHDTWNIQINEHWTILCQCIARRFPKNKRSSTQPPYFSPFVTIFFFGNPNMSLPTQGMTLTQHWDSVDMRHEPKNPRIYPALQGTNMAPGNWWLVDDPFLLGDGLFPGDMLISWRVVLTLSKLTQDNLASNIKTSSKNQQNLFFRRRCVQLYNILSPHFQVIKKTNLTNMATIPTHQILGGSSQLVSG